MVILCDSGDSDDDFLEEELEQPVQLADQLSPQVQFTPAELLSHKQFAGRAGEPSAAAGALALVRARLRWEVRVCLRLLSDAR